MFKQSKPNQMANINPLISNKEENNVAIYNDLSQKLIVSNRNSKFIEITKTNDESYQSFSVPLRSISDRDYPQTNYSLESVLSVADVLLSVVVVTPLAVCSWRGLWTLFDLYPQYFPILPTFIVGLIIHIVLATCQDSLHQVAIEAKKHWALHILSHALRRLYTYVFLIATILHWRGSWALQDKLCQVEVREDGRIDRNSPSYIFILSIVAFCTLACMKCLRNATAPPFAIALDKGDYVFRFPTMFESKTKNNVVLHLFDSAFSVGIVGNLVTIIWRGLWILFDVCFPESITFFWYSWSLLIIGCILVGFVFRLQNLIRRICSNFTGLARILVADIYILFSIAATIIYWGGMWGLSGIYVLPDNLVLGSLLCHFVSFALLLVIGCSNSLLVRGIYKDAKEDNGQCVVFPCYYLRIVFQNEGL